MIYKDKGAKWMPLLTSLVVFILVLIFECNEAKSIGNATQQHTTPAPTTATTPIPKDDGTILGMSKSSFGIMVTLITLVFTISTFFLTHFSIPDLNGDDEIVLHGNEHTLRVKYTTKCCPIGVIWYEKSSENNWKPLTVKDPTDVTQQSINQVSYSGGTDDTQANVVINNLFQGDGKTKNHLPKGQRYKCVIFNKYLKCFLCNFMNKCSSCCSNHYCMPCPRKCKEIQVIDIRNTIEANPLFTSVSLKWDNKDEEYYDVYISDKQHVTNVKSPYTATGLDPGKPYEVYVAPHKADQSKYKDLTIVFTTKKLALEVHCQPFFTSALLTWDDLEGLVSYVVKVPKLRLRDPINRNGNQVTYELKNLQQDQDYEIEVIPVEVSNTEHDELEMCKTTVKVKTGKVNIRPEYTSIELDVVRTEATELRMKIDEESSKTCVLQEDKGVLKQLSHGKTYTVKLEATLENERLITVYLGHIKTKETCNEAIMKSKLAIHDTG